MSVNGEIEFLALPTQSISISKNEMSQVENDVIDMPYLLKIGQEFIPTPTFITRELSPFVYILLRPASVY